MGNIEGKIDYREQSPADKVRHAYQVLMGILPDDVEFSVEKTEGDTIRSRGNLDEWAAAGKLVTYFNVDDFRYQSDEETRNLVIEAKNEVLQKIQEHPELRKMGITQIDSTDEKGNITLILDFN